MIHLKGCFHKNILKYGIVLLFLFTALLVFFGISKCIKETVQTKKNEISYRTVDIVPKSFQEMKKLLEKYKDKVETSSFDEVNYEYHLVFKTINYIDKFLQDSSSNISKLTKNEFSIKNEYSILANTFSGIMILLMIIILALVFFFAISIIKTLEKDISLYKLIGYKNYVIIGFLFIIIYIFYLLIFLVSILLSNVVFYVISISKYNFIFNTNLKIFISLKDYFYLWLVLNISIVLSFFRIIFKLKRITPMSLIKSCS